MYVYVWEYLLDPERSDAFERLYGPEGAWVELFRRSPRYLGTDFYQDRDNPERFITIDRWRSEGDWQAWRETVGAKFEALDRQGDELTVSERAVGRFDRVANS